MGVIVPFVVREAGGGTRAAGAKHCHPERLRGISPVGRRIRLARGSCSCAGHRSLAAARDDSAFRPPRTPASRSRFPLPTSHTPH